MNQIKLTENNNALSLKVDTLSKNIDSKNKEIEELKQDNKHLQEMVDYFKNLFSRLVKLIKNKMFGKEKEREDYWKASKDMYEHGIFSDDTIESIKDDYVWNKENDKHKDKGRDDFELQFFQSVLQVMNYFISSSLFLLLNTIKMTEKVVYLDYKSDTQIVIFK